MVIVIENPLLTMTFRSQENYGNITCMELLPDNISLVVGCKYKRLTLCDLTTGQIKGELQPQAETSYCRDITIHPDGNVSHESLVSFGFRGILEISCT